MPSSVPAAPAEEPPPIAASKKRAAAPGSEPEPGAGRRVVQFFVSAHRDEVFFLASALSFNALMAAIPFAMLFLGVLGYLLETRTASAEDVRTVLNFLLPDQVGLANSPLDSTEGLISAVIDSRANFSRFGIPLFILFSTRLFTSARTALDMILGRPNHRKWFFGLARDVLLVILTTLLFAGSALAAVPAVQESWVQLIAGNLLGVIISTLLFFFLYSIAPARVLRTDTVVIASFFAAFAFEAAKMVFSFYLAEFATVGQPISHANAIGLILFVGWIYYTAAVFLLGGEFAKAYEGISPNPA